MPDPSPDSGPDGAPDLSARSFWLRLSQSWQALIAPSEHWVRAVMNSLTAGGKRTMLVCALTALIVALPCALLMPPLDRDESRFAQATAQMVESGNYVDIRFQDQPRYKKPVGIHWLQSAAVNLTSDVAHRTIFPYRWPSMIGAALAALAVAWGAKALFDVRTAQISGLFFGLSFLLSSEAFIAKTDAVLCGLTTLMMAALARIYVASRRGDDGAELATTVSLWDFRKGLRKEKWLFWLALSLSIMIKGPIGPMIMAACLISLCVWDKTSKLSLGWVRHLGWGWGLLLVLAICGPWAIAITVATDGAFWGKAVGDDLAPKLAGGQEGHAAPFGTHTLLLSMLVFPASFMLAGAFETGFKRRLEPAVRFAICWFLPGFLIFEISPTKLVHYPLPTYGGLFWLMALSLSTPLSVWTKRINMGLGALAALMISAIVAYGYIHHDGTFALLPAVILTVGAAAVSLIGGFYIWRDKQQTGLGILILTGLVCHLCFVITLSQLKDFWLSQKIERALIAAHLDPRAGIIPGPVSVLGYSEPSLVFELGTSTQFAANPAQAVAALGEERPVWVDESYRQAFLEQALREGMNPRPRSRVKGYNYSEGDPQTLTLYQLPQADRLIERLADPDAPATDGPPLKPAIGPVAER